MKNTFKILALVIALAMLFTSAAFAASTYTVESGDSLWTIANKFGISVDDLMSANNLKGEGLQIGQVLKIPSANGETSNTSPDDIPIPDDAPVGNGYDIPTLSVDFIDAISFEVIDTDVRDILNIIANYAGKKIVYLGEAQKVTVTCSLVSCMKAINLVVEAADGLSYISDGDFIIVGPESRISSVMMYSAMTKTLTLDNMTSSEFVAVLEHLGLDVSGIMADETNTSKISVTAKPKDLARVVNAKYMIDKGINFPLDELAQVRLFNMSSYSPKYATREIMKAFTDTLALNLTYLPNYKDDGKIIVAGSKAATQDLDDLFAKIDTAENVTSDTRMRIYSYTVSNISRDDLFKELNRQGFSDVSFITRAGNKKIVFFIGNNDRVEAAVNAATKLDVKA